MPNCSVVGCSGNGQNFKFPNTEKLQNLWKEQLNRINFEVTINSRVCERHFTAESFVPDEKNFTKRGTKCVKKRLKPKAYPTLFLDSKHQNLSQAVLEQEMLNEIQRQGKEIERLNAKLTKSGYNRLQTVQNGNLYEAIKQDI